MPRGWSDTPRWRGTGGDALIQWDLGLVIPETGEARCFLYLKESGRLLRTCIGCGRPLVGRQVKWCWESCRVRISKETRGQEKGTGR